MRKKVDPDVDRKKILVGRFYESVARRIFGGKLSRNEDGDLCLWDIETSIEVKSSGYQSSYGYRLSVDQIERNQQLSLFPFSRVWYVLFAYRNAVRENGVCRRGKRRRTTELAAHKTLEAVNGYLAGATMWCLVYDLSIVSRWRETRPISTKSLRSHLGTETIDVKCRSAHDLANGGFHEGLSALGYDPRAFGVLKSTIKAGLAIEGVRHRLVFPLTAVLPREELALLDERLTKRRFATEVRTD